MKVVSVLSTLASLLVLPMMSHASLVQAANEAEGPAPIMVCPTYMAVPAAELGVAPQQGKAGKDKASPYVQIGNIFFVYVNTAFGSPDAAPTPFIAASATYVGGKVSKDVTVAQAAYYPVRNFSSLPKETDPNTLSKGEALLNQVYVAASEGQKDGEVVFDPKSVVGVSVYFIGPDAVSWMTTPGIAGLDEIIAVIQPRDKDRKVLGSFMVGKGVIRCENYMQAVKTTPI